MEMFRVRVPKEELLEAYNRLAKVSEDRKCEIVRPNYTLYIDKAILKKAIEEFKEFKCERRSLVFNLTANGEWEYSLTCHGYGNCYGNGAVCREECKLKLADGEGEYAELYYDRINILRYSLQKSNNLDIGLNNILFRASDYERDFRVPMTLEEFIGKIVELYANERDIELENKIIEEYRKYENE